MKLRILLLLLLAVPGIILPAGAVAPVLNWNPHSNSLNNHNNWLDGENPSGNPNGSDLVFDVTEGFNVDLLASIDVRKMLFTGNFPAYVFNSSNGSILGLSTGITLSAGSSNAITFASGLGILLDNDQTWEVNGTLIVAGPISGSFGLTKTGAGALTVSGPSTFSGGLTLSNGSLYLGASSGSGNGPVGTGTLSILGGTTLAAADGDVTLNNNISVSGQVTLGDSEHTDDLNLTGNISGNGSLTSQVGTVTLSGTNTFGGGFTLQSGELVLGSSSNTGASFTSGPVGTGRLTLYGGSYLRPADDDSTVNLRNDVTLQVNEDHYIHLDGKDDPLSLTLSGIVSGGGGLDWHTPGTLTLTNGGNTFEYGTKVRAGTLLIGSSSSAHLSGSSYVLDNGPLGKGSVQLYRGTKLGVTSGTQTLHNNIFLQDAGYGVTFDTTNGNLVLLGQIIGSSVPVTKTGSGILTLGGSNEFNGGLRVEAGTLNLARSSTNPDGWYGPAGRGTLTLLNGTTLGVASGTGATSLHNTISLDSTAGTVTVDTTNADLTLNGIISGLSGLTKAGSNTLTLAPTDNEGVATGNTYTGATIINGGVLAVSSLTDGGSASGIGASDNSAGNLVLNGGTLRYTGSSSGLTYRNFTLGTNGGGIDASGSGRVFLYGNGDGKVLITGYNTPRTLKLTGSNTGNNSFNLILGDNVSDGVTAKTSLYKDGLGTWWLNSRNTYTGTTTVNQGTLRLGQNNGLSNVTDVIVAAGATLDNADHSTAMGSLSGAGNVTMSTPEGGTTTLTIGASNLSTTFSGVISGGSANKLEKTGTGTLTLSGVNTYGGGTTVSGGTLIAGNNSAFGTGSVTLSGGGIGVTSGVSLSNPLVFSGSTAIVLGGNGTFATHITADSHVVLSPGNSPGTLTFSAGLTLATGTAISFQVQDAAGSAGVGYDLISVTAVTAGALNLTAATDTITFNILSLNSDGNTGNAMNFNPNAAYSWTFATSPNANIVGFDPAQFHLINGFSNAINGGSFSFTQSLDQRSLLLNFTPVPEPSTWLLLGTGLGALALKLRRRRANETRG